MQLALDKNGRLGRQVRSLGLSAVVAPASQADSQRSVIVSNQSIQQDQYNRAKEIAQARSRAQVVRIQNAARTKAAAIKFAQGAALARSMQAQKPKDARNEMLKGYFGRQANMSETEQVHRSVKADFYDREMIPGEPRVSREFNTRSDFQTNSIVGSPLTRDGSFGPSTDYDRFVYGTELDNATVQTQGEDPMIVGGTILGRNDGRTIPFSPAQQMGRSWKGKNVYRRSMGDSADDYFASIESGGADSAASDTTTPVEVPSEDNIPADTAPETPGFFSNLATAFSTGVATSAGALPGQLITQALTPAQVQQRRVIAIAQATNPVSRVAAQIGIPAWTLYAGIGILGVGTVLMLTKKRG